MTGIRTELLPSVASLLLGAEDLTSDLGVPRSVAGDAILLARHQMTRRILATTRNAPLTNTENKERS